MMKRATTAWHGQSTKQARKQILRTYPTWDFARRSGDSWVQTIGVTQGELGQSTEIGKKQLLYEIGVTAAPHPVTNLSTPLYGSPLNPITISSQDSTTKIPLSNGIKALEPLNRPFFLIHIQAKNAFFQKKI
jgi:hypothetical protein